MGKAEREKECLRVCECGCVCEEKIGRKEKKVSLLEGLEMNRGRRRMLGGLEKRRIRWVMLRRDDSRIRWVMLHRDDNQIRWVVFHGKS